MTFTGRAHEGRPLQPVAVPNRQALQLFTVPTRPTRARLDLIGDSKGTFPD